MNAPNVYTLDMLRDRRKYTTAAGEKCDGVTSITGTLDKPALLYWAHKLGAQGISLDQARQGAANIGTVAHARIEANLRDMVFDEASVGADLFAASTQAVDKFMRWWDESKFELVETEYAAVNEEMKVGGRMDIWARRPNGSLCLVDVKTSSGIYPEMRLQLGGYVELVSIPHRHQLGEWLWGNVEAVKFDEVWIARVGKDEPGDIDPVEIPQSDLPLLRRVFKNLAMNHYDLKRVLSRR